MRSAGLGARGCEVRTMTIYWVYDLSIGLFGALLRDPAGLARGRDMADLRRGIVPQNDAGTLEALQPHLASFEPTTEGQKTRYAETYREFDRIVELRRIRLKSVVAGLPMPLWSVVLVGAFLNIAVTWFFDMRSHSLHFWMTLMF